jgi:transcriptional antiterminator Rof (Rho-off)
VQILTNGRGHLKCGTAKDCEFFCQFPLDLVLRLKNNNKTAAGTSGRQLFLNQKYMKYPLLGQVYEHLNTDAIFSFSSFCARL